MLRHLHIENYALIRHLDIDFEGGFSVITGETGAGKSIILGALGLVMGAKADSRVIREGASLCVIEAVFEDRGEELIIRRELHAAGRSRSFVNDEVVSQTDLKTLASRLIDIHSQHENLLIGDDSFQLGIIDTLAQNDAIRTAYHEAWQNHEQLRSELTRLRALAAKSRGDEDYIRYQYNQLSEAQLVSDELDALEQEEYRLSHADELAMMLRQTLELLDGDEGAITKVRASKTGDGELDERLESVRIELKDIASEAERMMDHIESNPERLNEVTQRLDLINTLLRKHNVSTVDQLITLRDEMEQQLDRLDHFDDSIADIERQLTAAYAVMEEKANRLTESRRSIFTTIITTLEQSLTGLGIRHAKVDIALTPLSDYTESGHDDIQLLFAANLGQTPRRVAEVASGGEISRVMLSIKSLIASTAGLPTIIFDEIDTGVSGEIAVRMGEIMHQMGGVRQIVAITHLPQIATQGDIQYHVYKADTDDHTETHIARMTDEDRKQYIEDYHATISGKTAS